MSEVNLRKTAHNKLVSFLNQIKAHPSTPLSYHAIVTLRHRSRETFKKCETAQDTLILAATDETAIIVQESAFAPIEATYQEIENTIAKVLLTVPDPKASGAAGAASGGGGGARGGGAASGSGGAAGGASGGLNIKLPAIALPTFDGNYANWVSFKDLLDATIGKNTELSGAQKLQYLKSSLQGEPANLIKAMSITDANYTESWTLLNERYENKREIVQSLISKFLNYKHLNSECAQELQALLDCVSESLRALKVLSCPTDKWDDLLIVILVNKLDPATRREWAIRQTGTTLPTFDEFSKYLSGHIRGLLATGANTNLQFKQRPRQVKVHHAGSEPSTTCVICSSGNHFHHKCHVLHSKSPSDRSALVRQQRLCFNCLSKDHPVKKCQSKSTCRKCGKRHHTLLHFDEKSASRSSSPPPADSQKVQQDPVKSSQFVSSNHINVESSALLKTAIVNVADKFGKLQPCRVFVDGGSQADFISESCVNRLQLHRRHSSVPVQGFGGANVGRSRGAVNVTLVSRVNTENTLIVDCLVLPKLTSQLPNQKCQVKPWSHLQGLSLADPEWNRPAPIDIVIGIKHFAKVIRNERRVGPEDAPVAYDSIFGWIVAGQVPVANTCSPIGSFQVMVEPDIDFMRRFWEIEEPPHQKLLTEEEKQCEDHFVKTHSRDETGRYHVRIPFNGKQAELGYTRDAAIRRLYQVERRFQRQPEYREQYISFMREYANLGHMSSVPPENSKDILGKTYYLPHHFVVNNSSTTTKLRVVFDGSAKSSSGLSLNDTMMVGAKLQDDLYDQLLRFRSYPIVLKADIAKMFRQFRLHPEDQDFHRIVWRESPSEPIRDYWLQTITYGTACATFLSTRCVEQLSSDIAVKYPAASKALEKNMFVDDLMYGVHTPEKAIQHFHELNKAVKDAGMELRKWCTNHPDVLAAIPEDQRETLPQSFEGDTPVKALGAYWYPTSDVFKFSSYEFNEDKLTKRILLSNLATLFDPLGLVSCITIRAKLLLQELWKLAFGWDDPVPDHFTQRWYEYKNDIALLPILIIPRRITIDGATKLELHGFADASEAGYGGIIYLRSFGPTGIEIRLVTSKTRVAPIKPVSIPRLELCAAVETAKLIVHLRDSLEFDCPLFLWSDSTITLRWIAASPRRWKTFVSHRVAKIQQLTPVESWRHVPGVENPADLCSRGVSVSQIINDTKWFEGPNWLKVEKLPVFVLPASTTSVDPEERTVPVLVNQVEVIPFTLLERFSTLGRLKRVTAYVLRFWKKLKKMPYNKGVLHSDELTAALNTWIRYVQQQHFKLEMDIINKKGQLPRSSKLCKLFPYIDSHGILRVGGRLRNSSLPEAGKHQVILPGNSHLVYLLTLHHHHSMFHAGFQHTWATIQREYWIVRGRDRVRHILRSCVTCRRFRASTAEQLMGDLPSARVTPSRAFVSTGVDFCGPFTLKNPIGRAPKTYKGYLCVFVCMVTKAVHLEAVNSMSTEAFLDAFRRFVSRRGFCRDLFSDQGSNFLGADRELKSLLRSKEANDKIEENLSSVSIRWHFNPPASPHHGGLWEAAVKSAKFHIRRVIGNNPLTYEQLTTLLCQIEAVLNSRPLTPLSSEPGDVAALTPGHFLVGEPLTSIPEPNLEDVPTNRLKRFQLQQQRLQHFWRRWSREYLHTLQQRNKWMWEKGNVQVGDLVLLKEDSSPCLWKMARIQEIHPGGDGKVRVATIKTSTSIFERPILLLGVAGLVDCFFGEQNDCRRG